MFAIAVGLFVYPIIKADYSYYDDASRVLFLGDDFWRLQGRLFMELVQTMASFSTHSIDVFPLTLFLVLPVLVAAMVSLCRHYFPQPCLLDTQVVMPILYTPFILAILNYQYDGPMVVLGMCCVIFAVTFNDERRGLKWVVSGILLAASAGLYQTTVQIFVGLCCIDCIRAIDEGAPFRSVLRVLIERVMQLVLGLFLYYISAFQLYTSTRGSLARPDGTWWELLRWRAGSVFEACALFVTDGNRWLFVAAGIVMGAGLATLMWSVLSCRRSLAERCLLALLCLVALAVTVIAVPGPLLVIDDFSLGPRTLIALSCVCVLGFYFARKVLWALHPMLTGLLIIPLFGMLSFSYAYGRVLVAEKTFETSIVYSVSHDLASNSQLRMVKDFYLLPSRPYQRWVPGSVTAVMEAMPAIKFVLTLPQMTTPERFPMMGITNVTGGSWEAFMTLSHETAPEPIVNNRFYDIVRIGDVGFIQLKAPEGSGRYKYVW